MHLDVTISLVTVNTLIRLLATKQHCYIPVSLKGQSCTTVYVERQKQRNHSVLHTGKADDTYQLVERGDSSIVLYP